MKKKLKIIIGSIAGLFLALIIIGALSNNTDTPGVDSNNRSIESAVLSNAATSGTTASTSSETITSASDDTTNTSNTMIIESDSPVAGPIPDDDLYVHFIDVGQADSILIRNSSAAMLIDGGNNNDADLVVSYIKSNGIGRLDYVIGTHPHEDHIGGLDVVISTFEIGKVIMPQAETTTQTFLDLLTAISNKGLKITAPVPGTGYTLGNASFVILAPNSSPYDDLNDFSVVIKLTHGQNKFIFTGDAEALSESEMLARKYDLKADLLKIGHHGSSSSTSDAFLQAVDPDYAVISVGKDNSYGHPALCTLEKLSAANIQIYRTDEAGTITAVSDGVKITIDKKASAIKEQAPPATTITTITTTQTSTTAIQYIGNKNTKKFHLPSCSYLPDEKNRIYFNTRQEAIDAGYAPCQRCNP